MAQFDTSSIAGFEDMTAEQKVDALLKAEIPEAVDMSKFVSKDVFDKKASEAASLSKQLKDKMTDDEARKAEEAQTLENLKTELETLRKDKTVSEYTAKYIALGYEKSLAEETAKAMAEGDMAKVFANGEKHKEALEKDIKEKLMKDDPRPGGGGGKHETDPAVDKAVAIAKSKIGNGKTYDEIMSKYKK